MSIWTYSNINANPDSRLRPIALTVSESWRPSRGKEPNSVDTPLRLVAPCFHLLWNDYSKSRSHQYSHAQHRNSLELLAYYQLVPYYDKPFEADLNINGKLPTSILATNMAML
jgi:hypothetical protein